MHSKLIRLVMFSFSVSILLSLFAGNAISQCGLPGTPPCKKKASTVSKRKSTRRVKTPPVSEPIVLNVPMIRTYKIACLSPDIPNTNVTCPDDVKPEYLPSEHENGYDIAIVQYDHALLRDKPKNPFSVGTKCVWTYDTSQEAPCEGSFLSKGDNLVILDRHPTDDWLNVIQLKTGKEGWVYKGHITIYYTQSPKTSPVSIQEERGNSYDNPEITIKNQSWKTMTLRLGASVYTLPPNTQKTITIGQGFYKFYGSFPQTYPILGEKYFSVGYIYTWTFWTGPK